VMSLKETLLHCDAVYSVGNLPTFREKKFNIEGACSGKDATLLSIISKKK
jgi:hypothetical protein